jgi:dTDP-4-dehydrorhamnose reductase
MRWKLLEQLHLGQYTNAKPSCDRIQIGKNIRRHSGMSSQSKPRVMVLGSKGQLGVELCRELPSIAEVQAYSRSEVELTDSAALRAVIRAARPDFIVNAAAYTAVDRAESEPDLAYSINAMAPMVLAEEAMRCGAWLIHFSTDYVFDGSKSTPWLETDIPHPLNVYGKSKLGGEDAITSTGCRHLIFRTSWVYAAHGNNFLRTMLRLAQERTRLTVVDDQIGTPTSAHELAHGVRLILGRIMNSSASEAESGIYHMTCAGSTSWLGFAQAIFSLTAQNIPHPELAPISTEEYKTVATRPKYSVLNGDKLERAFGFRLAPWDNALAEVIRSLR